VLARIAHELFWLGRNVTRAELTARMVDGVFQADVQARPAGPVNVTLSWTSLLAIMGVGIAVDGVDGGAIPEPVGRDQTLAYLTLDEHNRSSVTSCVARAREGARSARDAISAEMWEAINTFHLGFNERGGMESGPYELASYVKNRCALFWGLSARTMLRDEAYAFLEAGGRLESADMVLRMLRVALPPAGGELEDGSPRRDGQALALLQAVGGLQAYSRALAAPPDATPVARFLLFTRSYPDSVAASVEAVRIALSAADAAPRASEPVLRLSRLSADLEFRGGATRDESELRQVCEIVSRELGLTDHDITDRYFGGPSLVEQVVTG
jgi:uncharacterized alpha-E superfamily protein